ncbi:hypothetical protein ABZV93_06955 [Actinopolymorpha sp. NPDC004070]|uniref:hypothetical protein n=1 Tax=Actinopolymorpha sp. NPDC004070 TaxID=3154548 RepID=UPI0033AB33C5
MTPGACYACDREAEFDRLPPPYVAEFGEAPGFHLHFHVVPRPVDLHPDLRGPRVFGLLGRDEADEVSTHERDAFALRLAARLRTPADAKG